MWTKFPETDKRGYVDHGSSAATLQGNALNIVSPTGGVELYLSVSHTIANLGEFLIVTNEGDSNAGYGPPTGFTVAGRNFIAPGETVEFVVTSATEVTGRVTETISNEIEFASNIAVGPVINDEPTADEIATFAGTNTDRFYYYTRTSNPADDVTHVFFVDIAGNGILINKTDIKPTAQVLPFVGNAFTWDSDLGENGRMAIANNSTLATPTNLEDGQTYRLLVENTSIGPDATVTFSADYVDYTGTALGAINVPNGEYVDFTFQNDNGTLILEKPYVPATRLREFLTVVSTNTINNLANTPVGLVEFSINGLEVVNNGITNSGQTITVNAANLQHNIVVTDIVTAKYSI